MSGPADSSIRVAVLTTACANRSSRPSALEEEITRLFDQLRNPMLRYVLSVGLSPQDGEEVIQEVFLSLFKHLRQGKSRHNLRGWVFRVAHNLALKRRCAQARALLSLADVDVVSRRLDPGPNPEEALAAKQRRERLLAVVRALPEQDRCCLHLRAEGLRYREIAGVLGISLATVSLSLVRSLARLSRADGGQRLCDTRNPTSLTTTCSGLLMASFQPVSSRKSGHTWRPVGPVARAWGNSKVRSPTLSNCTARASIRNCLRQTAPARC